MEYDQGRRAGGGGGMEEVVESMRQAAGEVFERFDESNKGWLSSSEFSKVRRSEERGAKAASVASCLILFYTINLTPLLAVSLIAARRFRRWALAIQ